MAKKKHKKLKKEFSQGNYFRDYYSGVDRILFFVLVGFFLFGVGLSFYYDTWKLSLGAGLLNLSIFFVLTKMFRGKLITRLVSGILLWNFSAQFIAQMHGLYEMHFFFFISCTILLLYKDWKVIVPITLYTVIHHLVFYYLNYFGNLDNVYRDYFVDLDYMTISTLILHLLIAAIHALLCGFGAYKLKLLTNQELAKTKLLDLENKKHSKRARLIKENINLANMISTDSLPDGFEPKEKNDMTLALLNMSDSLAKVREKEVNEKYVIEGLSLVEKSLRSNNDNLKNLSNLIISDIVNYTNSVQGALFLVEETAEEKFLELKGAYAYDRTKFIDKKVMPGEGLAGECWLEGKPKYMKKVPNNYVSIKSTLGKANPRNIYIVPLIYNEITVGVMEISSFELLDNLKVDFINKVAENIAASVSAVKVNERTARLLSESQEMAEQMRAQEEELRQNQEEMMATQEETTRQMNELKEKYAVAQEEIKALKQ